MKCHEVNFDGLVGLTHSYAGLSHGNLASNQNAGDVANPRAAAKQGLEKMKALSDMGFQQAVLPPHERPHLPTLRRLGFRGSDRQVFETAWQQAPELAAACTSAAAMWVANAATVSPWLDSADGHTHFTPANLSSMFHRSIESETTGRILRAIFSDPSRYRHHAPLPAGPHFGDEGAANHTRFCDDYHDRGVELFVFGRHAFQNDKPHPTKFPARQTFEASRAIATHHQLAPNRTVFAQQNPAVIDAGVFHNDVIAVGDRNLLLYHEQAFLDPENVIAEISRKMQGTQMHFIEVPADQVSVADAVSTYLFNTQLLRNKDNQTTIVAPLECQTNARVNAYLEDLFTQDNPIQSVHYFDLRQSMKNGGGPACLRLRVVMSEQDIQKTQANVFLNEELYRQLGHWIDKHYRDQLGPAEVRDPNLITECHTALDELTRLLKLGSVYDFQLK